MKRAVLPVITIGLFAVVVADRIADSLGTGKEPPPVQGPSDTRSATVDLAKPAGAMASAEASQPNGPTVGAPTLDRLARLAARQRLSQAAGSTYLDSLIISTDSVVRRWPDRYGLPLRVAIIEGGPATYDPRMAGHLIKALERWEEAGAGIRFITVADTGAADIQVRWIDHFDFDRAGQTDLTWDQAGRVRKAAILLAIRTNTGVVLPDAALLTVAVHEAGHALGLPHSPDTNDVMFPATQTGVLSERDRRTAQILYQLPTGPVRDSAGTP